MVNVETSDEFSLVVATVTAVAGQSPDGFVGLVAIEAIAVFDSFACLALPGAIGRRQSPATLS